MKPAASTSATPHRNTLRSMPAPHKATAVVLLVAAVMNAAAGNLLWLWYTTIGAAVFTVLVVLQRRAGTQVPDRLVWLIGLSAALHYLGGSLSGMHWVGGPNGAYYMLPWWDNVVHVLGSAAVAGVAVALWPASLSAHGALRATFAVSLAVTVGALVELYEFLHFAWAGTIDQGFYTNTMIDLWNNLLGAVAGTLAAQAMLAPAPRQTPRPLEA